MYLKYKGSTVRIIITLFFIFVLVSCTNNYGDTNTNDDAINKTDIKNDNTVITNIENSSLLEDNSNPLIFNKINPSIVYDNSQDKIDIRHDNTAISINLFGDDESDLTLIMNGSVVSKGFDGRFNYTYEVDLKSALKRISVFSNDANRQILILPATTEEYLTYNAILFDDSGFLHTYMFEIAEWHCGGIESITANTKADANAIKVIDNTGKSCSTHIYLIDGEYIKEDPKSFSFTDIVEKHEKKTHKIFTFDINGDGIDDKVITHINKLNSSGSGYQGNDLVIYLGVTNDKYMLSLNSINYTQDGLFYFSSLSPRTNSTGFILSTYFGSRGYPYKDYYFTLDNDQWKIAKVIVKGYMGDNAFYCEHLTDYNVSNPTAEPENLEVQNSENDILNQCPAPPTKYTVISEKAEILTEGFESRSSPNYYIKDDSIEAVNQNEDWVKVSYKNGTKFGWVDKRNLKSIPN